MNSDVINLSNKHTKGGLGDFFEMGLYEGLNYVLFSNPVSATVTDAVKYLGKIGLQNLPTSTPTVKIPPELESLPVKRLVFTGNPFIRFAGISGACAIMLGAYGSHSVMIKNGLEDQKRIYQTANIYHFMNSLALLGVPLCRHPNLAGCFITTGTILFCGTCYYDAFTGKTELRKFTPVGGIFMMIGWLCFLL